MQHLLSWCYTGHMTTTLLRHSITETPEIAAAIDIGAAGMPGASRADVVRSLIRKGAQVALMESAAREAAVEKWAGCLTGSVTQDAAQALKDEWPD